MLGEETETVAAPKKQQRTETKSDWEIEGALSLLHFQYDKN